jgi:hypothetical protein
MAAIVSPFSALALAGSDALFARSDEAPPRMVAKRRERATLQA